MACPAAIAYFERLKASRKHQQSLDERLAALLPPETELYRRLARLEGAADPSTGLRHIEYEDTVHGAPGQREQLVWQGTSCVHCKGNKIQEIFDVESDSGIIDVCFAWFDTASASPSFTDPTQRNGVDDSLNERRALFGPFAEPRPPPWSDKHLASNPLWSILPNGKYRKHQRAVCIALRDVLLIKIQGTGQTYSVNLPFAIRSLSAARKGVIVQRSDQHSHLYALDDPFSQWTLVALSHPLQTSFVIAHVCCDLSEPPLVITYDSRLRSISTWTYEWTQFRQHISPPPVSSASFPADDIPEQSMRQSRAKEPRKSSARLHTVAEDATMAFTDQTSVKGAEVPMGIEHEAPTNDFMRDSVNPIEQSQLKMSLKWTSEDGSVSRSPRKVAIFDCRYDDAIIAILDSAQQTSLFRFKQTQSENVRKFDSFKCDTIDVAYITRPHVKDMVATHASSHRCLAGDAFHITNLDSPRRPLFPFGDIARKCLATLSQSIPVQDFRRLYSLYLDAVKRERPTSTDEPVVLLRILLHAAGCLVEASTTILKDPWSELQRHRSMRPHSRAFAKVSPSHAQASSRDLPHVEVVNPDTSKSALSHKSATSAMIGIHRLLEDIQFSTLYWPVLPLLRQAVMDLSVFLGHKEWSNRYARLGCFRPGSIKERATLSDTSISKPSSLISDLLRLLRGQKVAKCEDTVNNDHHDWLVNEKYGLSTQLLEWFSALGECTGKSQGETSSTIRSLVESLYKQGWQRSDLTYLSDGPKLVLLELLRSCVANPPNDWAPGLYDLVGREDIALHMRKAGAQMTVDFSSLNHTALISAENAFMQAVFEQCPSIDQSSNTNQAQDAKPHESPQPLKTVSVSQGYLFDDRRLEEVVRILSWTKTVVLDASDGQPEPEPPTNAVQANLALNVATRSLSLPIGAALFDYQSLAPPERDSHKAKEFSLSVKLVPFNMALSSPDHASLPPEQRMWPDFHAGAALAVSQIWAADQQPISGLEFNFARPNEMTARAAGYLLGLGVTGHLRSMVVYQAFSYLDPKNELVSAGVLIGLSAAFTGTADARVTSLLSVHLAALLPQKSTELNISLVVQSSALLGLGLLYMATGKKTMAELMAKELTGIRIKHHEEAEHCREAYALGAGFAFGMIMLQKGRMSAKHAFDDNLVKQLHSCIDIHGQHPLPGMHKAAVAGIDVAITSSAATVALALMFLDSSRKDIAQLLPLPQAIAQLDYIRPDLIMLRTIARSIICLSSIKPDPSWVQSIMPKFLAESLAREKAGLTDMSTDLFRAYWSVVCGACYAIGLKYAGTAHADAHTTLLAYYDHLAKAIKGHSSSLMKRFTQSQGMSIIGLSLAMIFAGTGDLEIFRRLRLVHGRMGDSVRFSTHFATSQSIGLLFMGKGKYTLGTSPASIAINFCSFYPDFPTEPVDNRSHLQAARHLWPLAVEPRCLQIKDVDSGQPVPMLASFYFRDKQTKNISKLQMTAPCLFPELQSIHAIKLDSVRYWPITLQLDANAQQFDSFVRDQTIFVKRHSGRMDYADDPKGLNAVVGQDQGVTTVFDGGQTAVVVSQVLDQIRVAGSGCQSDQRSWPTSLYETHLNQGNQGDANFAAFAGSVSAECLLADKMEAAESYRSLQLAINDTRDVASAQSVSFATAFYSSHAWRSLFVAKHDRDSPRLPLIERSFIEDIENRIEALAIGNGSEDSEIVKYLRDLPPNPTQNQAMLLALLMCPDHEELGSMRQLCQQTLQEERRKGSAMEKVKSALALVIQNTLGQIMACGDRPQRVRVLGRLMQRAWLSK